MGFEELIQTFLWRLSSFLPYKLKRSTKCGGRVFKCLYPHILPWAFLQLNLFQKLYVSQAVATVPSPIKPMGVPGVWIKFQRGRRWICLTFCEARGAGPASWALRGINLISETHNSLLTAARICPVAPSSMTTDVFFSGRTPWFSMGTDTAGIRPFFSSWGPPNYAFKLDENGGKVSRSLHFVHE